ncbi:aryl-alcohol oxidase-like protein [Mycena albidolilacea]|uniref:Aryl-alcohol oxidase-like protein n=1 Tax=Mycena albidolilacea TaxID=1033008 RepID=A0AAD6Z8Q0_9AGAR|nr:aryl-alcohol oxidase-like protein [Mycena albidolilacea]
MHLTRFLLLLTGLAGHGFAKIYEDVSDLPGLEYDFSCSNEGVIDSIVPFFVENLLPGPNIYEWNFTTTPQIGLNNRTIPYPRDGMIYTRGSAEDFNRYAAVTGDPGWSWDNLLPYFFKNEKWTAPADHHDTRGQFNRSVHSTDGINSVSLSGYRWPIFEHHVLQTTREFSDEFPFNLDFNSGEMLGVGWLQSTIGEGRRSTSATSYLAPKFVQRNNLHVLLHAQVSRLVDPHKSKGVVTFGGVEFLQGKSLFTAKATKEIILSAGSVGTPNILMHSGVGDRKALTALGISSVLDLPSVGQNATEQPSIHAGGWSVNSTQTVDSIHQNATLFNDAYREWNTTHTGPFVDISITHIAWLRLDADSPIFENVRDPAAGPNTPHIELGLATGGSAPVGNFINSHMIVLTPTSRGSVTLRSNNPFDPPLLDLGLLKTEFDIFTAREVIKRAYRFFQAPVWKDYIIAPTIDLSNLSTEALDEFIRNNSDGAAHLVSTAAMSARDASYGVAFFGGRIDYMDVSLLLLVPTLRRPLMWLAKEVTRAHIHKVGSNK